MEEENKAVLRKLPPLFLSLESKVQPHVQLNKSQILHYGSGSSRYCIMDGNKNDVGKYSK